MFFGDTVCPRSRRQDNCAGQGLKRETILKTMLEILCKFLKIFSLFLEIINFLKTSLLLLILVALDKIYLHCSHIVAKDYFPKRFGDDIILTNQACTALELGCPRVTPVIHPPLLTSATQVPVLGKSAIKL